MRFAASFVALIALVACDGGPGGGGRGVVDSTDTGSAATNDTGRGGSDTGVNDSGAADSGTGHNPCSTTDAIVTDIDATLTTKDSEWLTQIVDSSHDPEMRPDANTLMQGYADKGYAIFYITARGTGIPMTDDRDPQTVTEDWLTEHGFPDVQPSHVMLADGLGAFGNGAESYKAQAIADLQGQGFVFDWGYGNATSDIGAYRDAGMDDSSLFMVGDLAGQDGVTGITNDDAYTQHLPFLSSVSDALCPE